MGLLTFGLNVTLDGCYDHREMIADDELHDSFTPRVTSRPRGALPIARPSSGASRCASPP